MIFILTTLTALSIHALGSTLSSLQQVRKILPRLWRVSDRLSVFITEVKNARSYISIPHTTLGRSA
jgi:hypothetical protein